MTGTVVVIGLAETGTSVARRLRAEGDEVVVVEDTPGGRRYATRAAAVRATGASIVEAPAPDAVAALVRDAALVVPSPLVRPSHPAIVAARRAGVPVRSEIDLGAERARAPIVAVTGTNGKTTVATLTAAMLDASGRRAATVGNIGRPLIAAADDDVDVLVVEVSSFQLTFAETFRPRVAVLLAITPDHLDWHGDMSSYAWAKSRVCEHQRDDDLLVYDADDDGARAVAAHAPACRVGVSARADADACFRVVGDVLVDPGGRELVRVDAMRRALPHDRTNALAGAAAALRVGATVEGLGAAVSSAPALPHRVALVGEAGGVRWYDDSKATNPGATRRAIAAFDSVVLLAGGRNKGLDLSVLSAGADHVRAVVAFGESAPEVAAAFAGTRPVAVVSSVRDAVRAAAAHARPGDAVLLSPACASFDAFDDYAHRGDVFAAEVRSLLAEELGR